MGHPFARHLPGGRHWFQHRSLQLLCWYQRMMGPGFITGVLLGSTTRPSHGQYIMRSYAGGCTAASLEPCKVHVQTGCSKKCILPVTVKTRERMCVGGVMICAGVQCAAQDACGVTV